MNAVSDDMRAVITAKLAEIEADRDIKILLAVESGSRAWGFHSEDSDYDVRFIYARPVKWHFQIGKKRDVVEYPIDAVLDISGWDVGKTLGLAMRSNAVVAEWLQSPIWYRSDPDAVSRLTAFTKDVLTRKPVTWHCASMLHTQFQRAQQDDGGIRIKRFFYALRPALTLRFMRMNDTAFAPMDMINLMAGCDLPVQIHQNILDLITQKKALTERASTGPVDPTLVQLIQSELESAEDWLKDAPRPIADETAYDRAQDLHFSLSQF